MNPSFKDMFRVSFVNDAALIIRAPDMEEAIRTAREYSRDKIRKVEDLHPEITFADMFADVESR
jgi:hypothetical protein